MPAFKQSVPDMKLKRNAGRLLQAAARTYLKRNAVYGNNYKEFGRVMQGLFPRGLTLTTEEEWNRFGVFVMVMVKVTRYAQNFKRGGHADSAHDLAVYAAMLEELTS